MKTQWWDKRLSKDGCLWGAELHFDMGSENRGWQWLFEWAAYDDLDTSEIYIERQAQNFCSRCGKRTPDLTTIHTCTPPRGLEMT